MPASSAIIGRVTVKVLPDTDDFRKDAQRKLDAIESRLKIKVPALVDMTSLRRSMLEGLRAINAENRTMDSRKVRLYTTLSADRIKSELGRVIRLYNAEAKGRQVKINTQLVASNLHLELDKDSLDHVKKQIDDWRKENSPILIPVRVDLNGAAAALTEGRLRLLTRPRTVSIIPTVNPGAAAAVLTVLAALSGGRVLNDAFDGLWRTFKNLDKSIPMIGTLALAVMGLGAAGISATSNLAALSASLAMIGPAALALPGLLGGIAIGVGIMVMAFKDFGAIFPDVAAKLAALQDLVSANFWAKAQAPMRSMIEHLLPQFVAGFGQAATQLGGWFGALSTAIKTSLDGQIKGMFQGLSDSINIATGATKALAQIVTDLGKVGAALLPRLAAWFVDITTSFSEFINTASKDGRLQGWINNGIALLGQLGSVLASIGRIFAGIGTAALDAGGSNLFTLADSLRSVADAINSTGVQAKLSALFAAAHDGMANLYAVGGPAFKQAMSAIASTLTAMLPVVGVAIGQIVSSVSTVLANPAIQGGIRALFNAISQGLAILGPAFESLAPAVATVMQLIALAVKQLAPLFVAAIGIIGPVIETLVPAIMPLVTLLSDVLGDALVALTPMFKLLALAAAGLIAPLAGALKPVLAALMPIFAQLGDTIGIIALSIMPVIGAAFAQLVPLLVPIVQMIGEMVAQILPAFAAALLAIMPALVPLIATLIQLVVAVLKPLLPAITQLVVEALPKLAVAIVGALNAVVPFVKALVDVVNFIMPILVPALMFLASILIDTVIMAINGVKDIFNGVLKFVMGVWNTFAGLFTGDWGRMWNGIKQIFSGLWTLIVGIIEVLFAVTILGIFRKGFLAIKGIFTESGAAIKGIWSGAWNAIQAVAQAVWSALLRAMEVWLQMLVLGPRVALGFLRTVFAEAWAAIRSVTSGAFTALRETVELGVRAAIELVKGIPGRALAALGDLGSVLSQAGRLLIQGFLDGITGMIGKVKDKLGELTGMLPDWKGPAPVDAVLLYGAGRLVIGGFINGLESQYDAVRKSLASLTSDVEGTVIGSPQANLAARVGGLAANAQDGQGGSGSTRTLNYYAAPGSSLGSEEDLFAAAKKPGFGW